MTYYPNGTLVRHRYHHERGLGIVMRRTSQVYPMLIVKWFSSTLTTSENISQMISIEEIDNDE